ncbi:hypothetical protein CMALT430_290006 [Carnobacterium maltaromaticum]|nr:hypothetical protein CMALT430_290006 [Carnobacterium maltaromaticum]
MEFKRYAYLDREEMKCEEISDFILSFSWWCVLGGRNKRCVCS